MEEKTGLDAAALAGRILLQNGAEIFRVEETIERIAKSYGMEGNSSFVLSSGIFITEEKDDKHFYANVKHIPLSAAHLDKVAAVNQLSREIEEGKYTATEAIAELEKIQQMPEKPKWAQILASGIGSACFGYLFGGTYMDSIAAFIVGSLLWMFLCVMSKRKKRTTKIMLNLGGGMFLTSCAILIYQLGIGDRLSHIVIGSIIPLVPGVAFTNGIRDLANEDYISGIVRLVDALLIAFCIALGVGIVFTIYHRLTGGGMI
ncbi:threonine/serine exporter family protein [Anaerosporobacter faecicola]|uniref:threonine/serine ThrE exporter family protein n=1 Tax=Anaerosporobacter faecicola TaxID=2718714 RepID=UPI00143C0A49|nr:threonine/serine exporter family protein [Anaerosporobacter faecicola]